MVALAPGSTFPMFRPKPAKPWRQWALPADVEDKPRHPCSVAGHVHERWWYVAEHHLVRRRGASLVTVRVTVAISPAPSAAGAESCSLGRRPPPGAGKDKLHVEGAVHRPLRQRRAGAVDEEEDAGEQTDPERHPYQQASVRRGLWSKSRQMS